MVEGCVCDACSSTLRPHQFSREGCGMWRSGPEEGDRRGGSDREGLQREEMGAMGVCAFRDLPRAPQIHRLDSTFLTVPIDEDHPRTCCKKQVWDGMRAD